MHQVKENSILNLTRRISALAELQSSHGTLLQKEFVRTIQRLQIAVEGPEQYVFNMRHQPVEYVCTLLAIESGVLQALVENDRQPLSVQKLAEKTKTDQLLITRFLRVLAAISVVDEVGPSLYRSNSVSERLNEPGQAAGFVLIGKLLNPIAGNVPSLWENNQFTQFPDYSKGEKSPMIWVHKMHQWDQMRGDPKDKLLFDKYMSARRSGLRHPWHEVYPAATELDIPGFQAVDEPPLLVDVGGNTGYEAASFKSANPHIKGRCVVEDLPETLVSNPITPEGVERMGYDIFTPQPIKGARAYFFKQVCHDYDDANCRRLLSNTVAAMSPESSLLIDDWVLPDEGAPLAGASEDVLMLVFLSGMERSESQWKALLSSVGLNIKNIWRKGDSSEAVIEAKRVEASGRNGFVNGNH